MIRSMLDGRIPSVIDDVGHLPKRFRRVLVALVEPGQQVKLLYEAFPYQRYGVRLRSRPSEG